jgi:GntR family transcriptional regulator
VTTRYERVAAELRRRIKVGELGAGEQLPSETELATQYDVSMPTIRHALELVRDEGLVEKRHGVGTFVRVVPRRIAYVSSWRSPASRRPEVDLQVRVRASEVKAQAELSSLLRVTDGTPLTEFVYRSWHDEAPYSLAHAYVPCGVAEFGPPCESWSPWGDDIRASLLAAGVTFAATVERVTARMPTPDEAETLQLPARASVLAVKRTSTDTVGRVVEGTLLVLPGDRTEAVFTTLAPSNEPEGVHYD